MQHDRHPTNWWRRGQAGAHRPSTHMSLTGSIPLSRNVTACRTHPVDKLCYAWRMADAYVYTFFSLHNCLDEEFDAR